MARIRSISIPEEKETTWKNFEEIARREKGTWGVSQVVVQLVEEYVKVHGSGNPTYTLDQHMKAGFSPYPTPWTPFGTKELAPFSWKEEDEMIERIDKALTTLKIDRQAKRNAEIKAKMNPGEHYASKSVDTWKPR